jgi:hypothetical protein
MVALSLFFGDLSLLVADRHRLRRAIAALVRSQEESSALSGDWQEALQGWGLAIALKVVVAVVVGQIRGWH